MKCFLVYIYKSILKLILYMYVCINKYIYVYISTTCILNNKFKKSILKGFYKIFYPHYKTSKVVFLGSVK